MRGRAIEGAVRIVSCRALGSAIGKTSGGARSGLFLPPYGAKWSFEHPANADRRRTRVELQGSVLQQSLGLSGSVPLAQIVEPCWTVISLCQQLAVSQLACDGPTVRAVPLAAQRELLHRAIKLS